MKASLCMMKESAGGLHDALPKLAAALEAFEKTENESGMR